MLLFIVYSLNVRLSLIIKHFSSRLIIRMNLWQWHAFLIRSNRAVSNTIGNLDQCVAKAHFKELFIIIVSAWRGRSSSGDFEIIKLVTNFSYGIAVAVEEFQAINKGIALSQTGTHFVGAIQKGFALRGALLSELIPTTLCCSQTSGVL